ncbi:uncharacterized protein LOC6582023 isoform X1 [Drosophila mojavensis]|uniref:Uncharacterized protein n=1 Tax=Drosophila mojavensis TaxID=7230 RepID=A0A0Q9XLM2_DROMO|nr:uncharacterized protein LOC6582023 isoform X1 [Drosophila mojavensis]KRG06066.1 uncharacterized protein Dmoj_GI12224 [Drosophila mojavensis]
MCLRCVLNTSHLLARSFCLLFLGIVELIIVLAISRVVWILVVLCTTGSLAIFGLTKFLRMAYNPPEVQQGDNIAGANLTALNYTVAT